MFVFRIVLAKYATELVASGRAARWNSNDVRMIYTSSSRSLACLENIVHRSQLGLSNNFKVLTIEIPGDIKPLDVDALPENWNDFEQMHHTQAIGDNYIAKNTNAVLKVPSSIIRTEFNYLLNPAHVNFDRIKLVQVDPFLFDDRIKR